MAKKTRIGLQIRFNPEFEQDLIEFFSPLKKAEVHITAISAFRMYMRSIGFFEGRRRLNHPLSKAFSALSDSQTELENEELLDEAALSTLDRMFDAENNLNDQGPG